VDTGHKARHSPPSTSKFKYACSHTSTAIYVFVGSTGISLPCFILLFQLEDGRIRTFDGTVNQTLPELCLFLLETLLVTRAWQRKACYWIRLTGWMIRQPHSRKTLLEQRQSRQQVSGVNTRCQVESIRFQAVGTCKTWYDMIYDMIWWYDMMIWYDTIYFTATGLPPGGSSTVQYTFTHKQYTEQHNRHKQNISKWFQWSILSTGWIVKVKATKVQRWSRGIALLFNFGARWGWVVNATPRPLYPREDPVPIIQEAGWASVPVWTGAENVTPTGIRSSDHPVRESDPEGASFCTRQSRLWGPSSLVYSGCQVFFVTSKAAEAWRSPSTPSSAEVK